MRRPLESTLLFVFLAVALAGGAAAWFAVDSAGEGPPSLDPLAGPGPGAPRVEPSGQRAELAELDPRNDPLAGPDMGTTVIHPLRLDLTLMEGLIFQEDDVESIGSGATATLRGLLQDIDGSPLSTQVEFVEGPNQGRVLRCDSKGRFGASNLYEGLSIVRLHGKAGSVSEREVSLMAGRTQDLNVSFQTPATVYGTVTDMAGEAIEGVSVRVDGKESFTDGQGEFVVRGIAAGSVLFVLEKEGYALYREIAGVSRGAVVAKDRLNFRLAPGCTLEIFVEGSSGGPGPAQVFLIPGGAERVNSRRGQRTFPWYRVSPLEIQPGSRATVQGLQEGRLNVMVFRPGAVAREANVVAKLVSTRTNQAAVTLKPAKALTGFVRRGGEAVAGARVVLEAPNRTRATVAALRRPASTLSSLVMPHLPAGRQEVLTDSRGLFRFTPYSGSPRYYLSAELGPEWRGGMTVGADETGIELELSERKPTLGDLEIELPGRFQSLPVEVWVDGSPRDPFLLAADDDLKLEELPAGTWRLDASWYRVSLLQDQRLKLDPSARLELRLPEKAIIGQTEEERRRAGQ